MTDIFQEFHASLTGKFYLDWLIFLRSWCGNKNEFIREVGIPFKKITRTPKILINQLLFFTDPVQNAKRNRGPPNVWLSVYGYRQETALTKRPKPVYSSAIIDEIFFDFDVHKCIACELDPDECDHILDGNKCEGYIGKSQIPIDDLETPFEDAVTLQDEGAIMVFSGRKGFQIHQRLEEEITQDKLLKEQKRKTELWGFTSVDTVVFGDIARICRLPFPIHPISGLCCVIVRPGESLESVLERAERVHRPKIPEALK